MEGADQKTGFQLDNDYRDILGSLSAKCFCVSYTLYITNDINDDISGPGWHRRFSSL